MKKYFIITLIALVPFQTVRADPIVVIIKTAVVRIIKAMDLAVQRLQNETIKLQNAQKAIENAMAKLKLQEISEWAQKQHDIFNKYYEDLKTVRSYIAQYHEIKQMIQAQKDLINEYKTVFSLLKQDKNFTPDHITTMEQGYKKILDEAAKNIDMIITVIKSYSLQMSDAARIELINNASQQIKNTTSKLRYFSRENIALSIEMSRDAADQQKIKAYYNIP